MHEQTDLAAIYRYLKSASIASLLAALDHPIWSVRSAAISRLARSADSRVVPTIITALSDPNFRVVEIAIMALGHLKAVEATDALIHLLPQPAHTYITARALADIGTDTTISLLIRLLSDSEQLMRLSAATALGFIRDERLIEPLTEALHDESSQVRQAAVIALESIRDRLTAESADDELDDDFDRESEVVPPF